MPIEKINSLKRESPKSKEDSSEKIVSVREVPDWHLEPATPLWEFGKKIKSFSINHNSEVVSLSPEVLELRKKLEQKKNETFFSGGPFANVEDVRFEDDRILIKTRETDFFSYIASSYFYRKHQEDNPIPVPRAP